MKVLFIGDIYGQSGRQSLECHWSWIKDTLNPDFIIANVDNAAHGYGITPKLADELFALGVDCLTGGDHIWDRREIFPYIEKEPRLLRPMNMANGTLGKGYVLLENSNGQRLVVTHLMGTYMMKPADNAFFTIDSFLKDLTPQLKNIPIVMDFHAEATSEKMAMGHYCDGRLLAVVGTHTHIPTADAHILSKGAAYITDIGMTGDFNSIIGADTKSPMKRFLEIDTKARLEPAKGEGTICGVIVDTDTEKGAKITSFRKGGFLDNG